jgi:DNA-binding CsgD family transcriptional regulator
MDGSTQACSLGVQPVAFALQAMSADVSSGRPVHLSSVWTNLAAGHSKILSSFSSATRSYFLLAPPPKAGAEPASRRSGARSRLRDLRIVQAWFSIGSQKRVALELGLSTSTVATATKRWLAFVGLSCLPSYVPPLLVMAGRSAEFDPALADARTAELVVGDGRCQVVSALRPDNRLSSSLPPAEYEVVRLFLEGRSHREVALLRGSSPRTVANQLAMVFHRFGVSGRAELVIHLLIAGSQQGTAGAIATHRRPPATRRFSRRSRKGASFSARSAREQSVV